MDVVPVNGGGVGSQPRTPGEPSAGVPPVSATRSAAEPVRRTFLSLRGVGQKFGVSDRTAHKIVAEGWFPAPLELAPRVRRWVEQEIEEALAARAPRRAPQAEPQQLAKSRAGRSGVGAVV